MVPVARLCILDSWGWSLFAMFNVIFAAEREIIFTLIGKPHQVEAITANFENRPAKFGD